MYAIRDACPAVSIWRCCVTDASKSPDLRLEIGDTLYGGWTSVSIRRGIGQLAGTFDLSVSERWPGQTVPRPIQPGASCRVLIDGRPVITGYVDDVRMSYNGTSHEVTVSGRDKTCDLVDCCPPSMQLSGATLAGIARSLAAPFGIEVIDKAGTTAVPGFKPNPGDTCFEILEQLSRASGVFLTTDGEGRLVITRVSTNKAPVRLELGRNVREGKGTFSMRDRYSEITVLGQTAATETWNGVSAAQQKTVVRDKAIPRHRPLVLVAEQEHAGANKRAQWEINTRYGKGNTATYTVYGWMCGSDPWSPNVLVSIVDGFLGLDVTWLLGAVTLSLDAQGYRAELTLSPPEAYEVEPISPKRKKGDDNSMRWPDADTGAA